MYQPAIDHRRCGADRRVKAVSLRFPERRRGFARRQAGRGRLGTAYGSMIAAYRARPHLLAAVLVAIAALNVADLLLTLRALELGADELNPIMATLLDSNLAVASAFKVTMGIAVVTVIWLLRRYRLILEASLFILAGFTLLATYGVVSLVMAG